MRTAGYSAILAVDLAGVRVPGLPKAHEKTRTVDESTGGQYLKIGDKLSMQVLQGYAHG